MDSAVEESGPLSSGAGLPVKSQRPSLSKIILSMESNLSKRQALFHILQALQILYSRLVELSSYQHSCLSSLISSLQIIDIYLKSILVGSMAALIVMLGSTEWTDLYCEFESSS